MRKITCAAVALIALCGCFKVKDELEIQPDGSGTVRMEVRTGLGSEMMGAMGMGGGGQESVIYPPISETEARKFFPEKKFKLSAKQQRNANGESVLTLDAAFNDINDLLASAYGRAHALTILRTNGALKIRALTGVEGAARAAEIKDESGMMGAFGADPNLEKQKQDMRIEFRISLPNAVTEANSDAVKQEKSVAWIYERAKFKDAAEFAQKLGTAVEASCPDNGIRFTPTNQVRLASLSFSEVPEDAVQQGQAVDAAKIRAAARFVPCALHVTRSLDLAGEGTSRENSATFVGAILVPSELAPDRWGEPKLIEAVDAKGTNLKPSSDGSFSTRSYEFMDYEADEEGEDDEGDSSTKPAKPPGEKKRIVTLAFQPPDWKVNEIARIKGTVSLQYYSGAQVLKLSNAIPAKWIVDASNERNFFAGGENAKLVVNQKLADKGLKLSVPMAMAQAGGTMLNLTLEGEKSGLTDAQVFDANGRPWPTFLNTDRSGDDEERTYMVMVAGKPQPPLSLALMITGAGASVELPIGAEKVPVRKD